MKLIIAIMMYVLCLESLLRTQKCKPKNFCQKFSFSFSFKFLLLYVMWVLNCKQRMVVKRHVALCRIGDRCGPAPLFPCSLQMGRLHSCHFCSSPNFSLAMSLSPLCSSYAISPGNPQQDVEICAFVSWSPSTAYRLCEPFLNIHNLLCELFVTCINCMNLSLTNTDISKLGHVHEIRMVRY